MRASKGKVAAGLLAFLWGCEMKNPDFFLASSEQDFLSEPRSISVIGFIKGEDRDDYLLVKIDPPLLGQPFGLGEKDISQLILATRHADSSLSCIAQWPVFVYVLRPLVSLESREEVKNGEMELIAWAEVYKTEDAARKKVL